MTVWDASIVSLSTVTFHSYNLTAFLFSPYVTSFVILISHLIEWSGNYFVSESNG